MLRVIKIIFLILFITISIIGLLMSIIAYFGILLVGENALTSGMLIALIGVPFIFIPAVPITAAKSKRFKGEYRYAISFWPAIKNIPNQLAIIINVLYINIPIMIFLDYYGFVKDSVVLASGIMLAYYITTMIYLSSIMKDK